MGVAAFELRSQVCHFPTFLIINPASITHQPSQNGLPIAPAGADLTLGLANAGDLGAPETPGYIS